MFAKGVPWWCGVDVRDENDLVRRGMIRGKTPDGVFVDFDYPGHNRDFVPFDRCANHHQPLYRIGDVVEVLLRFAPDQPWRWYPAKLLAGAFDGSFAFVAADTGEAVVEKVLPMDAVRIVDGPKLSGSQILLCYFEHDFCGNLRKLTSGLIDKFPKNRILDLWTRETWTIGMKLEGGRLFYSSDRAIPWAAEDIENVFKRMATKYLPLDAVLPGTVADDTIHPDSMHVDQLDSMDDPITTQLSLDVVDEIFSFLTPIQRVACRRVCQLWNFVLVSISSTWRVQIDISTVGYRKLATMLHESVNNSTKVLILSGGSNMQQYSTVLRLQTVKTMLKGMNLSMQFIVLFRTIVKAEDLLDSWYAADWGYHSKWWDVCGTLILNDVGVWPPCATQASVVIKIKKDVLMDANVTVGVERVLEKWCPEISEPETDILQRQLREIWERDERIDRWYLWMVLTMYQHGDERFHPVDLVSMPPVGTLGVPALATLRKLTVWALQVIDLSPIKRL